MSKRKTQYCDDQHTVTKSHKVNDEIIEQCSGKRKGTDSCVDTEECLKRVNTGPCSYVNVGEAENTFKLLQEQTSISDHGISIIFDMLGRPTDSRSAGYLGVYEVITSVEEGFLGACYGGHFNLTKELLRQYESKIETYINNMEVVYIQEVRRKQLIEHGMLEAISRGHLAIIRMLVSRGANDFDMGMVQAASSDQMKAFRLMVDYGGTEWVPSVEIAATHGHVEIVDMCWKHVPGSYNMETPFNNACKNGHIDVLRLLEPMFEVDNHDVDMCLQTACSYGRTDVVEYLLEPSNIYLSLLERGFVTECIYNAIHGDGDKLGVIQSLVAHEMFTRDQLCDFLSSSNYHCTYAHKEVLEYFLSFVNDTSCFSDSQKLIIEESKRLVSIESSPPVDLVEILKGLEEGQMTYELFKSIVDMKQVACYFFEKNRIDIVNNLFTRLDPTQSNVLLLDAILSGDSRFVKFVIESIHSKHSLLVCLHEMISHTKHVPTSSMRVVFEHLCDHEFISDLYISSVCVGNMRACEMLLEIHNLCDSKIYWKSLEGYDFYNNPSTRHYVFIRGHRKMCEYLNEYHVDYIEYIDNMDENREHLYIY